MSFEIRLPLFEGPFDLLLFFIERNEIDIYDIPISQITDDFLDYLHRLEEMNIEVASEFILVAATLMKIKARMLIPVDPSDEDAEDPRQELVNYLLEYKKYKSVLPLFEELEEIAQSRESRGNIHKELQEISEIHVVDLEMYRLDLYKLLRIYESVLSRADEKAKTGRHTVIPYPYTVEGQKNYLMHQLQRQKRLSFVETMQEYQSKIAIIFNFLAILELLQNRLIDLQLGEGYNNFWIEARPQEDAPAPSLGLSE